jgi:DNA-binding transcriptional MerR regulator/methylmalonyl-CoA mutase cobalamin-binding subunit
MAKESQSTARELTYPLRAASRLTGLSPETLRAWERRYGVVDPPRTPGGTRRYRASDLERLRLVKAAVDAGHRVGRVANLDLDSLRDLGRAPEPDGASGAREEILAALGELDEEQARRLLSFQLSALGAVRFAREVATPLLEDVGDRWSRGEIGVPVEHLATTLVRGLLGAALQPSAAALRGPRIVFATPEGERHEIGLQMAALVALGGGAHPLYLGLELPVEDCVDAVLRSEAQAMALSIVTLPAGSALRAIRALREGLPADVPVWVGGRGAPGLSLPEGVECINDLERFEHAVAGLAFARSAS